MNKILLIVVSCSTFVFANDLMNTDLIPRAVNFFIFALILYYLIADKIKVALNNRADDIKVTLEKAQEKLQESKKLKANMDKKFQESEKLAIEIVKNAQKECKQIKKIYKTKTELLVENYKKAYNDKTNHQLKLTKNKIAQDVLNDFISSTMKKVSNENIVNTISKKVAS